MRRLFIGFALLGLNGTATACINDNELPSHEREFRSQYARAIVAPYQTGGGRQTMLIWGGVALMASAVALAVAGRSKG